MENQKWQTRGSTPMKKAFVSYVVLFVSLGGCAYAPPASSPSVGVPEVRKEPGKEVRGSVDAGITESMPTQPRTGPEIQRDRQVRVYDAERHTRYEPAGERTMRAIRQPAAVTNLLADADRMVLQESYLVAAAQVERALRVDPKSSAAYQKLSEIRFLEGKLGVAEQMAKRALSLVPKRGTDSLLRQKEIWFLLAEIRKAQGDDYGAERALKKAKSFW